MLWGRGRQGRAGRVLCVYVYACKGGRGEGGSLHELCMFRLESVGLHI